jgi:CheY-like chemotaxis protein
VHAATGGLQGINLLLQTRPDVGVIDIGLPDVDGYELAMRCRAAGFTGRLIAITGRTQHEDVRQALVNGFDAHLMKPVELQRLRRLLVPPAPKL